MIRVIVECLLLFLLPSVAYFAYAYLARPAGTSAARVANDAPVLMLSVLGAALVFTVMVLFGSVGDGRPGQSYVPAQVENGRVVPGRMQ
jgi:hypothetical protein